MSLDEVIISTPRARLTESVAGIDCWTTTSSGDGIKLAEKACSMGYKKIIAAGGDGTINEVVNGIFNAEKNDSVVLGVLRNGSGNDFARSLGMFSDEDSYRALKEGKTCKVDVGKATYINFEGMLEKRYFDNFAGVGFDAKAAYDVKYFKGLGKLDYLASIVGALLFYHPKEMSLIKDGAPLGTEKRYFANMANGVYGGRGIQLAPGAKINDGKFNLIVAGNVRQPEPFFLIARFYKGTHITHPKVKYAEAKSVEIDGENLLLHLDGEVVGKAPVKLEIIPSALNVVYLENNNAALI